MTVKELYSILDKENTRDWAITVYANDGQNYEVARTHKDFGIDLKIGIMQEYPYTIREVFDREVISYYICANSIIAIVEMWDELKEKVLQMEKNKEKQLKVYRILNSRKLFHTSEFQKPLEWFGKHTIEEAVEILSTETNIIQKGKGEYDEKL